MKINKTVTKQNEIWKISKIWNKNNSIWKEETQRRRNTARKFRKVSAILALTFLQQDCYKIILTIRYRFTHPTKMNTFFLPTFYFYKNNCFGMFQSHKNKESNTTKVTKNKFKIHVGHQSTANVLKVSKVKGILWSSR